MHNRIGNVSKELIRLMMDATPLCLNLWNKDFENIACNQEAVKLFGLQSELEYLNRFFELSPLYQPNGILSSTQALEKIAQAFSEGRSVFRWVHCTLDGVPIPAEVTLVRIKYQNDYIVAAYTRDLRSQIAAEKAASDRVNAMLDATPLACVLWRNSDSIIDCNKESLNMFAINNKNELIKNFDKLQPLFQPDSTPSSERWKKKMSLALENGRCIFEWMHQNKYGENIPVEVTLVRMRFDNADVIISYSRDLRELHDTLAINSLLEEIAYYDTLTGCSSRTAFMERLENRLPSLQPHDTLALLIFDFDNFKDINDTYGHGAGDLTLKEAIHLVTELLPPDADIGRYGGDEFLIRLEDYPIHAVENLANNILTQIASTQIVYEGIAFNVTTSIGGVMWNPSYTNCETILQQADEALYEAKNNGRNLSIIREINS